MICFSCYSKYALVEETKHTLLESLTYSMKQPNIKNGILQTMINVQLDSASFTKDVLNDYYYAEYTNPTDNTEYIFSSYLNDQDIQANILYQYNDSSKIILRTLPFIKYLVFDSDTGDHIIINGDRILQNGQVRYEFIGLKPRCTMRILLSKILFSRRIFHKTVDYKKAAELGVDKRHFGIADNSTLSVYSKYIELAAYDDIIWCSRFFHNYYHKYFIEKSLSFKQIRLLLQ